MCMYISLYRDGKDPSSGQECVLNITNQEACQISECNWKISPRMRMQETDYKGKHTEG